MTDRSILATQLFIAHQDAMRALLQRLLRNHHDIEDHLHDVWVKMVSGTTPLGTSKSFALHCAWSVAVDTLRRNRKLRSFMLSYDEYDLDAPDIDPDFCTRNGTALREADALEHTVAFVTVVRILNALPLLPKRQRQVFTLKKIYGATTKEIMREICISENCVENHMRRAGNKLAGILGDDGFLPYRVLARQCAEALSVSSNPLALSKRLLRR